MLNNSTEGVAVFVGHVITHINGDQCSLQTQGSEEHRRDGNEIYWNVSV